MDYMSFYAIFFFSSFMLISCSKGEPDASFEGTWIMQATELRNCDDSRDNSAKNSDFISNEPCTDDPEFLCRFERYIFDSGVFSRSRSSVLLAIPISLSTAGTFSLSGRSLELCVDEGPVAQECSTATMEIVGNTLILTTRESNTGCTKITFYLKQ
ncbi:hypothetical protein FEE95_06110 [Maribacter algarum]|uniref:Lipocalin-like domain-containing protein n=1 Tax=Maribacter algarum (ex Zhang et al. 2020) TaxID=2578118 RepID=A0A5S3PVK0_9FLAO|nr:hypothetical protein [Maribacter algarum]TMM59005.1 hypothetical protein FEE95_06110 [Maribacter algarum]